MSSVENRYINDAAFHKVVDQMRALLSMYFITPSEMREAACLASSMHENQNIKPLFIRFGTAMPPQPWGGMEVYIDEAKDITPRMFGGLKESAIHTATGAYVNLQEGCITGRYPSDGSTVEQIDRSKWGESMVGEDPNKFKCICDYTGTNKAPHSQTCKDYNWGVTHPKPEHCHIFGELQAHVFGDYRVCNCGMSDIYYNWSTKK